MKLDRIDRQILEALQNNARLSNKELAAKVNLAPSSCLERVRRLTQERVIRGFHAAVDPAALGIELQAMIAVRLQQHSRKSFEDFRKYMEQLPQVIQLFYVAGGDDFLIHVAVRNTEALRDFALDHVTQRKEVEHMETALIFESVRSMVLPDFLVDEG